MMAEIPHMKRQKIFYPNYMQYMAHAAHKIHVTLREAEIIVLTAKLKTVVAPVG